MKCYITQLIKVDNFNRSFAFRGPDIIAEDAIHARLAMSHHAITDHTIIAVIDVEVDDATKPVQWDSLLMVSNAQKN